MSHDCRMIVYHVLDLSFWKDGMFHLNLDLCRFCLTTVFVVHVFDLCLVDCLEPVAEQGMTRYPGDCRKVFTSRISG
jgi:hypothetical protein